MTRVSPLVSSAFGRTRVGLRPTKRNSPSHARKTSGTQGKVNCMALVCLLRCSWDCYGHRGYNWPIADRRVASNGPRNNCGRYFGSSSPLVSKVVNDLLNIPKPNVSQNPLGCVELVSGLPQKVNLNKTGVNVILPSTVC